MPVKKLLKPTIQIFFLIAIVVSGIKLRRYVLGKDTATGIVLTQPHANASVNGIVKLSAKTNGDISEVKFVLTNTEGKKAKEVKAFFEHDANEWTYYLSSNGIKDDNYFIYAYASDEKTIYNDRIAIKVANDDGENTLNTASAAPSIVPPIENKEKIANLTNPEKEIEPAKISAPHPKEEQTQITIPIEKPKDEITIPAEIKKLSINGDENNPSDESKILSGVIKALSAIYDSINANIEIPLPAKTQGEIAGSEITKKIDDLKAVIPEKTKSARPADNKTSTASTTAADSSLPEKKLEIPAKNDWFKYELKITSVQENETITQEKLISAVCTNPLDSMKFILDNLETDTIDYEFKASSDYGYYTYWLYKLNPSQIKSGTYLLYAEGTIDWHKYQSPIVIVNVN